MGSDKIKRSGDPVTVAVSDPKKESPGVGRSVGSGSSMSRLTKSMQGPK
jgi:hypothetical protein